MSAPRLFGIPATDSPFVAVIRRGPSKWWNIGLWDTATPRFETGAWFRGTLYPQRCDLSPDGRWLTYLALKPNADWDGGSTYVAISRFPWLRALAAWNVGTTYSRGFHFVDRSLGWQVGEPDVGSCAPCQKRYGVHPTRPAQFAVERRRGWTEAAASPPRGDNDAWDERRVAVMEKRSVHGHVLTARGLYAAFRGLPDHFPPRESSYALTRNDRVTELDDVTWADWDRHGRLLIATDDGRIQIREVHQRDERVFEDDVSAYEPDAEPAPDWAAQW